MGRKRKHGRPVHGWINLDKPVGLTSTRAVGRVRRVFDARKAGHAGTLDPLASGVLPVALGEATKTAPYAVDGEKVYRFTVRFGEARATDDAEGDVIETSDARPADEEIILALPRFTGDVMQVPPQFSAVKVDGERAYDIARDGGKVELEPREVEVHGLHLVERPDADTAVLEARTGKGFYIRALARDLSKTLGTVGHVSELRRLQVAGFHENDAISLESLEALEHSARASQALSPCETALDDIPALAVTEAEARRLMTGQPLAAPPVLGRRAAGDVKQGDVVSAMSKNRLVALAEIQGGAIRPFRVFNL